MYDPALGRWHNPDPLQQFLSPYVYADNNPILYYDPDGMWAEEGSMEWARTVINPSGNIIYHDEKDDKIYISPDGKKGADGNTDGLDVVGTEKPGAYYHVGGYIRFNSNGDHQVYNSFISYLATVDGPIEIDATIESFFIPVFGWLKYVKFGGKIAYKLTVKITKQMAKRGWTDDLVSKVVNKPYATRAATNKATGNKATAFFTKDGSYVVKDNVTNEIVQVSNRADPNWMPDPTIVNPYIPKK